MKFRISFRTGRSNESENTHERMDDVNPDDDVIPKEKKEDNLVEKKSELTKKICAVL